jgi:hypothetical protein
MSHAQGGTLRKRIQAIWGKWSTSSGFALHPLQLIIAQRGVQLLKTEVVSILHVLCHRMRMKRCV